MWHDLACSSEKCVQASCQSEQDAVQSLVNHTTSLRLLGVCKCTGGFLSHKEATSSTFHAIWCILGIIPNGMRRARMCKHQYLLASNECFKNIGNVYIYICIHIYIYVYIVYIIIHIYIYT